MTGEPIPNDWPSVLKGMIGSSGKTYRAISAELGKASSYVGATVTHAANGSVPSAQVLADIAEACGYELHLTGHDRDIRIRARPVRRAGGSAEG